MKKILPYVLVETFLPGGSLIALGMWLYQNRERLPKWRGRMQDLSVSKAVVD